MDTQAAAGNAEAHPFGDRVRRLHDIVRPTVEDVPGLSNRELDRLAGLHVGHVWQIEEGHRENPTRDTAEGISRALGCTLGWLLAGEGAPPTEGAVRAAVAAARAAVARARAPVSPGFTANDFRATGTGR